MRVIRVVKLNDGNTALELYSLSKGSADKFNAWAKESGIAEHVELKPFYQSEMYGDIDYPAIQVKRNAPPGIVEFCILKWGKLERGIGSDYLNDSYDLYNAEL